MSTNKLAQGQNKKGFYKFHNSLMVYQKKMWWIYQNAPKNVSYPVVSPSYLFEQNYSTVLL